jgi:hypothetical protein
MIQGPQLKKALFYEPTDTAVSPDEQRYNEERNDFEHYTLYIRMLSLQRSKRRIEIKTSFSS